jgi:hypothetical protein
MSISIEIISHNKASTNYWKIILAVLIGACIGFTSANLIADEAPSIDWPSVDFGD